uniref:Rho GDP-dissociation inhibitor 1 n=1 Tax=Amphilophus citrinellus TaxID=61819 RepID=A0A3Q0SSP0_AMPCI
MADDDVTTEQLAAIAAENEEPEPVNYKPPAQKTVKEIHELDKDDESLRKYKEALLGPGISEAVDKSDYMVGSYGPRDSEYDFLTTVEEAPKGLLARGNYVIKSKFTDDDKHDHLSWEWNLNIKKDWKD